MRGQRVPPGKVPLKKRIILTLDAEDNISAEQKPVSTGVSRNLANFRYLKSGSVRGNKSLNNTVSIFEKKEEPLSPKGGVQLGVKFRRAKPTIQNLLTSPIEFAKETRPAQFDSPKTPSKSITGFEKSKPPATKQRPIANREQDTGIPNPARYSSLAINSYIRTTRLPFFRRPDELKRTKDFESLERVQCREERKGVIGSKLTANLNRTIGVNESRIQEIMNSFERANKEEMEEKEQPTRMRKWEIFQNRVQFRMKVKEAARSLGFGVPKEGSDKKVTHKLILELNEPTENENKRRNRTNLSIDNWEARAKIQKTCYGRLWKG